MDNFSPLPPVEEKLLTFGQALLLATEGKKIARKEWNNTDYAFIKNEELAIHKNGEDFQTFRVFVGDIIATDWMVVNA